jgi:hypothetical protein
VNGGPCRLVSAAVAAAAVGLSTPSGVQAIAQTHTRCQPPRRTDPGWVRARRMTVLVDSVLLSGERALRATMPCWRIRLRGRPALMMGAAERELAASGRRVAPVAVVGLGYNSLWERRRRHFAVWARRFDRQALALIHTLRRRGARQIVWVTLREPTRRTVTSSGLDQLARYAWYFPYANERLRRLDHRLRELALADWAAVSRRRGLTYDAIHLNLRGADLMARTIRTAVFRAARRPRGR